MTLRRSAFSNCVLILRRPLYGPRRDRVDSVSVDVTDDTVVGPEDGGDGGSGGPLDSDGDEDVVPLDALPPFVSDVVTFPARRAERANMVSILILHSSARRARARSVHALRLATRLNDLGVRIGVLLA